MNAKDAALKIILTKRRSGREVFEKLLEKEFSEEESLEAVEYFKEKGYIDDGDYARRYTVDAINLKGFGKKRIALELKRRGVCDEDIDAALQNAEVDILPLMRKKFTSCESDKDKNKIINHFLRRGFSFSEITDAIKEVFGEN